MLTLSGGNPARACLHAIMAACMLMYSCMHSWMPACNRGCTHVFMEVHAFMDARMQ